MRIVVEGEKYNVDLLKKVFEKSILYSQKDNVGIITHVGYYHSFSQNELIYLLPKVFIIEGKVFGIYSTKELFENNFYVHYKHNKEYTWVRQLLYFFYVSLSKFRKKYSNSNIAETSQSIELSSNLGSKEYSYLDLLLSFVNFFRKNKSILLLHSIKHLSNQFKHPNWSRTVSRSVPIFDEEGIPIYTTVSSRKKAVDYEEELLSYFTSILNRFNQEHDLNISFDRTFKIIEGRAFEQLQKVGLKRLKRIKNKYYSDLLKRMYTLCELYFSVTNVAAVKRRKEEFILVRNYNIVFEDMVDLLFSDAMTSSKSVDSISLQNLKNSRDGKIIDHLYEYESLIDTSNIFYIGDSKYYKSDTEAGQEAIYKQFSYAKNVIQFNIDLFNENGHYYSPRVKYRDELTEGYNISPNFFIYGYIRRLDDFDNPSLQSYRKTKRSFHFRDRLFDRDTLFVHFYQLNFLFVLKAYASFTSTHIQRFQNTARVLFKTNFVDYFNDSPEFEFQLFEKKFNGSDLDEFIERNFRRLNGKCIYVGDRTLVIAKHKLDNKITDLLAGFSPKRLTS